MNFSSSQSSRSVSPSPITQRKRIELIRRARRVSRCKFIHFHSDLHFIISSNYPLVLSEKSTLSIDKSELTTSQVWRLDTRNLYLICIPTSFSRHQPVMKLMSQITTVVKMKIYSQVAKIVCYIPQIKYSLIKLLLKSQEEILKFLLAGRSQYRIKVRVS